MAIKGAATELGTQKVGKLLMQYAIPAIIAMTASSLYNMVDSIFIGQGVGAMAISGLAITFPFMNLAAAFGAMVGVGASTLLSVRLGQKDYASAKKVLGNVVTLNLIIGILFSVVCLIFLDPILYFFGASSATLPYARDYMVVILLGNVFSHMYMGLNAMLRASGHPRQAMYATIVAELLNTALDPLFIYVFGWGVQGAAIATILAEIVSMVWQLVIFSNQKELIHLEKGTYRLDKKIVRDTIAIGLSPFLMNLTACFIVILVNNRLHQYGGDLAIGAYGITARIAFVFVMIVMGLNQGMQPIAGFNFGAKQYPRVTKVLKLTIGGATLITLTGFLIGELIPAPVCAIFTSDKTLIEISTNAMRISFAAFPIIGFQMVTTNFFQSIGMAKIAIFLSLTRQLLFLLPGLVFLPPLFALNGVWLSMPVSDTMAALVAGFFLIRQFRIFRNHAESLQPLS